MTVRLTPGVSLGNIPAGGVLADSDWHGDDESIWEPVSFAPKAANGKVRIRIADLVKLGGPEGYIHGYICVRPPCGPAHKEAEFNGKLGEVRHGGVRIGKMRKNADGTYSMAHHGDNGRVKLAARYATRADAAKSVALYHNVDKLHAEATDTTVKNLISSARNALATGDHGRATMFMAAAEARANVIGDKRLESHLTDTRAAIVDGPKAVSPPDVAGVHHAIRSPVPVPAGPPPLPENVKQAVNEHLTALNFRHHNQRVKDKLASARTAVDAGQGEMALRHLAEAHDAAFEAGDKNAVDHAITAHNLIAAHLGRASLPAREVTPALTPRVPSHPPVPAAPKVKRLPRAKAAEVNAHIDAAAAAIPQSDVLNQDMVKRARQVIQQGDHKETRHMLRVLHRGFEAGQQPQAARDHVAMADEVLAAHLKEAPFQARTITHANEHAATISAAAKGVFATAKLEGMAPHLSYLAEPGKIAAKLRDGNAGQVARDLRELDARAKEQQNFEWREDRKTAIGATRKSATSAKRDLEKLHQQDLSEQSFSDRAARLADDVVMADQGWRPISPPLRLAAAELANGDLTAASKMLVNAREAAGSQPRASRARQFEKDIADLHAEITVARQKQLAAAISDSPVEPSTATGILGDIQNERNQVSARLVNAIKSGVRSKKSPTVRGTIGETSIVTFGDGSKWVHKSANRADGDKEELASMVARAMGVRAPAVVRDPLDKDAVYMTFVNGKTAVERGISHKNIMNNRYGPEAADSMRRIGLMDYLIKNGDRHGGNFMIDQDEMPVGIDHGMAWGPYAPKGSRVSENITQDDFSPEYYAQIRQNLEALKPEFDRVASSQQLYHRTMMKQLDKWLGLGNY